MYTILDVMAGKKRRDPAPRSRLLGMRVIAPRGEREQLSRKSSLTI